MDYIAPEVETDPSALAQEAMDEFRRRIPTWTANPANPETIMFEGAGRMAAEGRDTLSRVPASIFRWYGAKLAGVPPVEASAATVAATVAAVDAQGYTLEAGTVFGVRAAGDQLEYFEVADDVIIAPGATQTAPGGVVLVAQQVGAAANGIGEAGASAEVVQQQGWIASVTLTGTTEGGEDAEEDDAYLNRLREELTLQSPKPILPRDFAVLARRVAPVYAALPIDLYRPADRPTPGNPAETNRARSVTLALRDKQGMPVPPASAAAVEAMLMAMRETNFEVWTIDPTYSIVGAAYNGVALPGWDPAQVKAGVDAAIAEYLGPAGFGLPSVGDGAEWLPETKVRLYELAEVINRVDGFWRLADTDPLAIGIEGGYLPGIGVTFTPGAAATAISSGAALRLDPDAVAGQIVFLAMGAAPTPVASGSITVDYPTPSLLAGDVMVGYFASRDDKPLTLNNGWTIKQEATIGLNLRLTIAWKRRGAGDVDTSVTATHVVGNVLTGRIAAYRNVWPTGDPFDALATPIVHASAGAGERVGSVIQTAHVGSLPIWVYAVGETVSGASVSTANGMTVSNRDATSTTTGIHLGMLYYDATLPAFAAADLTLPGVAPLPMPGTISGTVVAGA